MGKGDRKHKKKKKKKSKQANEIIKEKSEGVGNFLSLIYVEDLSEKMKDEENAASPRDEQTFGRCTAGQLKQDKDRHNPLGFGKSFIAGKSDARPPQTLPVRERAPCRARIMPVLFCSVACHPGGFRLFPLAWPAWFSAQGPSNGPATNGP